MLMTPSIIDNRGQGGMGGNSHKEQRQKYNRYAKWEAKFGHIIQGRRRTERSGQLGGRLNGCTPLYLVEVYNHTIQTNTRLRNSGIPPFRRELIRD